MPYGWTGTELEVDLTHGTLVKRGVDPEFVRAYLGGKGTNARLLWDRVPPEVDPFSPDSLLIIGTGILTGTIVPSANRGVITFKSPLLGLHYHCAVGGFWPAEIKQAGYDTIVISGKSPTPAYLWIDDDKVELRDASHLWGKNPHDTASIIREELKNEKVQVASIGVAGENKVYAATIECGVGASASRAGAGAVMGDKNLKAIAVYGTGDVAVARPARLIELCEHILGRTDIFRERSIKTFAYAMNRSGERGGFYGNLSELHNELPPDSEFRQAIRAFSESYRDLIDRNTVREAGCYNCGVRCRRVFQLPDRYLYVKCQSWHAFRSSSKVMDYAFSLECCRLCDEYGLDSISVSSCIGFAIDLYERGILTRQDTGGTDLAWGDKDVVYSLIEKIGRREGIGDILADGVHRAARQIGKGAEEHAHHIKKMELYTISSMMFSPYYALSAATGDKLDLTRSVSIDTFTWSSPPEARQELVESGNTVYPTDYERFYLAGPSYDGTDRESGCQLAAYDHETYTITDMTGICNFWAYFLKFPPINRRALMADLISSVTGMDIGEAELTEIARRTVNLIRAYNVRLGTRRKDDTVPAIFFEKTPSEPREKLDPATFDRWIDRFYELRGWNSDGIPTVETLDELGLGYVRQDLEERGILTG